jgi:hypothetical protein
VIKLPDPDDWYAGRQLNRSEFSCGHEWKEHRVVVDYKKCYECERWVAVWGVKYVKRGEDSEASIE